MLLISACVGINSGTNTQKLTLFTGAAVKSPLIMGNDIRKVPPADLAILSNAAVIAVNQDPSGSSASRRWIYPTNETDINGKATVQMWSGSLKSTTGGDQDDMVVLLITEMTILLS